MTGCRSCRCAAGEVVLDLGLQPACEYFPPQEAEATDPLFPLRMWLCAGCGLAQLADDANIPDAPEGVEPAALVQQRRAAVGVAREAGLLHTGATVAEGYTPHGGSWWAELSALGMRQAAAGEPADVVVDGTFGLMHARDQDFAMGALAARLVPDGVLLFQFHSLSAIVRQRQWNAVRHGHYAYYSLPALDGMLARHGLGIVRCWEFPLYGGTVLVAAQQGGVRSPEVLAMLDADVAAGVLDPVALGSLQTEVARSIEALRDLVQSTREGGGRVYGYSAASRAVTLLHLAGMGPGHVLGVADAAVAKQGCRMPGTSIPIITPQELVMARPDVVLMFVSDLLPEVREALTEIEDYGGRWADAGSSMVHMV